MKIRTEIRAEKPYKTTIGFVFSAIMTSQGGDGDSEYTFEMNGEHNETIVISSDSEEEDELEHKQTGRGVKRKALNQIVISSDTSYRLPLHSRPFPIKNDVIFSYIGDYDVILNYDVIMFFKHK